MKYIVTVLWLFHFCLADAAEVDTIRIQSEFLQKENSAIIIVPASYKESKNYFPVVYLLHGKNGDFTNWTTLVPEVINYADKYQIIIVCPDGGKNGWYLDSPKISNSKYESHIIKELVPSVDESYRTVKNSVGRAITGLSMGGHGAMYLGIKHPEIFGMMGSMSGALAVSLMDRDYLTDLIGSKPERKEYSVIDLISPSLKGTPITIDCGKDDFLFNDNQLVHKKLLDLGIDHDYTVRPGKHTWSYWSNSVEYHLLFFYKNF